MGLLFSGFVIYVIDLENGDKGVIGLYVVVFALPILTLGILNTVVLEFAKARKTVMRRRLWSLIPILLMALLAVSKMTIFDAGIWFLGIVAIPAFSITNLLWNLKLKKEIK